MAGKAGGFDQEEIIFGPTLLGHPALDNAVGVLDNEALLRLAEDIRQAHRRHNAHAQNLAQNVARANAGELVGVSYHNNTAVIPRRRQQRLEQLDVHHAHLIQDDDIIF